MLITFVKPIGNTPEGTTREETASTAAFLIERGYAEEAALPVPEQDHEDIMTPASTEPVATIEYPQKSVKDLRAQCKALGLDARGNRSTLEARLSVAQSDMDLGG